MSQNNDPNARPSASSMAAERTAEARKWFMGGLKLMLEFVDIFNIVKKSICSNF